MLPCVLVLDKVQLLFMRSARKHIVLTSLLVFGILSGFAQSFHGIVNPGKSEKEVCNTCKNVLNEIPMEVQYGIVKQGESLYFAINDRVYFDKLFADKKSGIAVDLVPHEIYACDKKTPKLIVAKGRLFPPLYSKELMSLAQEDESGIVFVPIGKFPSDLDEQEVEYNILFLSDKYLCHYERFWDIATHKWDLLEMGLYREAEMQRIQKLDTVLLKKHMKFVVPFEKNKFDYQTEDIKPLYDSLHLTDYRIVSAKISAFSSVEGPTDNNIRLQTKRAESIIKALEELNHESIITDVHASENWVEFMEEVYEHPDFGKMIFMSKAEIKAELAKPTTAEKIEPILSTHRKAILDLVLEKKNEFRHMKAPELVSLFKQKIDKKNLSEALEVQRALFSMIGNSISPDEVMKAVEVPNSLTYADFKLDQIAFRFTQTKDVVNTIEKLEKLNTLLPNNKRIRYNLAALKIKSWAYGDQTDDKATLWQNIEDLKQFDIHPTLLARLRINYKIIECEYLMSERKYAEKNEALKFIYDHYKEMESTEDDLQNMAKFFTGYGRHDWAKSLLKPHVLSVDVNEELLFYYLNLTIIDPNIVAKPEYQSIVLNAVNTNRKRYCKMFDTYGFGGITFQLMDDPNLKKFHCQECR